MPPRAPSLRVAAPLLLATVVVFTACTRGPSNSSRPGSAAETTPVHLAHYELLLRRQYTDSNPVWVQQELSCETARLVDALEIDSLRTQLERLRRRVLDSAGPAAVRRVQAAIEMRTYEVGGLLCDSLRARADSAYPLPPRPPS